MRHRQHPLHPARHHRRRAACRRRRPCPGRPDPHQRQDHTLGYTKDTVYKGGEVEVGADGKPTGKLIAKPNALILYSTPARTNKLPRDEQLNSAQRFYRELNRLGVTSAIDAGDGFQNYPDDARSRRHRAPCNDLYYLFRSGRCRLDD